MGFFTGTEMLFYTLGIITLLLVVGLIELNKKYHFQWYTWILSITGALLTIFSIAWSVSSLLEGETQAANIGLLVFGAPVLIIFGITKRVLNNR